MALNKANNDPSIENVDPLSEIGVLDDIRLLGLALKTLGHDYFQLAGLEAQRAGRSLVTMLIAGIMFALLLTLAWLGLVVVAILAMIENGIALSHAILLAVAGNLILVLLCSTVIRYKSRYLKFPALLRSLKSNPES
jgi:hypothetical protein